ncbi:ABC transporter permease [Thalassococcus sp. S3]|uniref:ABC transporter permease n=1 Tax=Thalassococcus sp. S3 TaxID=2017482 RepID=UPI0010243482|nr:ABC transporter permease subunit [Thalassococcus sp. S3]QBF30849.1 ABC transporter permease [Thalassococcus sp. S3]
MFLPVGAGLMGAVFPAFGYLPPAGLTEFSLAPVKALFDWPGLGVASRLSLTTGLLATLIALSIVTLVLAGWSGTKPFRALERLLSPLLAVPHAAAAFGLAFLIAPSGWLSRLLSPAATGWDKPPDLVILQDPYGLSMTAGLVAKEVPFLLLMALAAIGQSDARRRVRVAQALGYGRVTGWLKSVFPAIYAQIRLPVYVVLAYSMSTVDVALILGPTLPPPLSVQVVRWMNDPDLTMRLVASAGALMQLGLVLAALLVWRVGELIVQRLGDVWVLSGRRGARADIFLRPLGLLAGLITAISLIIGLAGLAIWSVSGFWGFPAPLPDQFTLRGWSRNLDGLIDTTVTTFLIAFAATGIAVLLVVGCLEAEFRRSRPITRRGIWLIYLPLLIPQIAFLPGLQTLLLSLGGKDGLAPVVATHVVFVLPYVFLSLGDPWRAWDRRHAVVAAGLGSGQTDIFWRVRLPMMLRPILTAAAVGLAVSIGQYLPTLLVGGGRVSTLTTEAVALAAGGDRRTIGIYAVAQTAVVMLPFALALAIPALMWRNRRGLHG